MSNSMPKKLLLFVFIVLFISFSAATSFAQSPIDKFRELQKQIDDLTSKLHETQNKATTLTNQITYMDNQIHLTGLKIQDTTEKVAKMENEIDILSDRIGVLESSLTDMTSLLIDRVVATYKNAQIPAGLAMLSSNGFSELISKAKYLHLVQSHDKKILFEVQSTKSDFESQKQLLEEKKTELDLLKEKLEAQQITLDQQKKDKQSLLTITKSDEKKYQDLLVKAKSEQNAIEIAMKQAVMSLKDGTPVDEGKEIAFMGNSGAPSCSTGTHLHMEFTKDGARQNPANFLKSLDVLWDNSPDGPFGFSGDWNWPMDGTVRITQGYGMTYFARTGFYGGGPHTGLDMVASNTVIKAPKSGTLYKGATSCGGSSMKWVAVDHGGGMMTWYFHVQ